MKRQFVVALVLGLASSARAAVFTQNTSIAVGDATYDGQDIVVSNCTLTVDGPHGFASLSVVGNGVVTHSPAPNGEADNRLDLAVAGDATVDATSAIHADGRGYGPGSGPGAGPLDYGAGAGHGGLGGAKRLRGERGATYGSLLCPVQFGSGGSSIGGISGGSGGGAITLTVSGTLTLGGSISANGADGGSSYYGGGGGSGGSVLLTCGTLAGGGLIGANGGAAGYSNENGPGGGGGGRITVLSGTTTFTGSMMACGNAGSCGGEGGGAGTVYLKAGQDAGELILDNNGVAACLTPITSPVAFHLVIRDGAIAYPVSPLHLSGMTIATNGVLAHLSGVGGTSVTVDGSATIEAGGAISLDRCGHGPASGPGAGAASYGCGAGHAGIGGAQRGRGERGAAYGDWAAPASLGSGGGNQGGILGGAGGGAMTLEVGGILTVDGVISANGGTGGGGYYGGGGGSGGSLRLQCGTFAGTGTVRANGGRGGSCSNYGPGGGGGGRVAVAYGAKTFSGTVTAFGGAGDSGGENAGAGTVHLREVGDPFGELILDNGGATAIWTPLATPVPTDLTILHGARACPESPLNLSGMTIGANGILTHRAGIEGLSVTVAGDALIESSVGLNGLGYSPGYGPGAGPLNHGAGAGHGGLGGRKLYREERGAVYGFLARPVELGSGGSTCGGVSGGAGGGAILLAVSGTLTLNGGITANGNNGASSYYGGGGGSGGSVLLACGALLGSGVISANGGSAWSQENWPGGGGGGRIALYCPNPSGFGSVSATATGGYGNGESGQNGTIYIANAVPPLIASQNPWGRTASAVDHVDVTFNVPIDGSTFTRADVQVVTPSGTLDAALVSVAHVAGQTWRVSFPAQSAMGTYSVRVGPDIQDANGLSMFTPHHGGFVLDGVTISGRVLGVNGAPVEGIPVRAGAGAAVATDEEGRYTQVVPAGWSGQLAPERTGCVFAPSSRAFADVSAAVTSADFTEAPAAEFLYAVETFAGNLAASGDADDIGEAARFNEPYGLALDADGNLFVADRGNHLIRKVSPTAAVTTLAGRSGVPGADDGEGTNALFRLPHDVALDAGGNVYVADTYNQLIRKLAPDGTVTTLAGALFQTGSADGTGDAARFNNPHGVAATLDGMLFVADRDNYTIRSVTPAGEVSTFAGCAGMAGSTDGIGTAARFSWSYGIALGADGSVFISDSGNATIRKVAPDGVVATLVGVPGELGAVDGVGTAARFRQPAGVAVGGDGTLFVVDMLNGRIRIVSPEGVVSTLKGLDGNPVQFLSPWGITVDTAGKLYVTDGHRIAVASPVNAPGAPSSMARFNQPFDVGSDGAGNLVVADRQNHTIRTITSAGTVATFAGAPGEMGSSDGTGGDACFKHPVGVARDASGNVYVADLQNFVVRKIAPGGATTTLAGTAGIGGHADGLGADARFALPADVAVDADGNVYVVDADSCVVRKITPGGQTTTLAGSPFAIGSADGVGSAARFHYPYGVAVDGAGILYVSDSSTFAIRKITPDGTVSTLAGQPGCAGSADGTGDAARFDDPRGLAVDGNGNLYVADRDNHTIRKITSGGTVTTLAGSPGVPGSADGKGSAARFRSPCGVSLDAGGNLYVADTDNHTIRKIAPDGTVTTVSGSPGEAGADDGASIPVVTPLGANPLVIEAHAGYATYVDPGATATDAADGPLVPTQTANTVVANVPGTYAVAWSATNSQGRAGSATRTVRVVDTTPPVIASHADLSVTATTDGGAVVAFSTTATDTLDGTVVTVNTPASGSLFAIGATNVVIRATDAAGNQASRFFIVTVTVPPVAEWERTIPAPAVAAAQVVFTVHASVPGRVYRVLTRASLTSGEWQDTGVSRVGTGQDLDIAVPRDSGATSCFYRFVLE